MRGCGTPVGSRELHCGDVVDIQVYEARMGPYTAVVTGREDCWTWEVEHDGDEVVSGEEGSLRDAQDAARLEVELLMAPVD